MIQPGEVYMADFGPAGPHPVIVVSREELNRGRYALAVVCTSARFAVRSKLSNCVPFQAGDFGFTVDCVAQCPVVEAFPGAPSPLGSKEPNQLFFSRHRVFVASRPQRFVH
jgi:mRNA-degrading endonuclease toxin of MazEF toxin-antitoxin module